MNIPVPITALYAAMSGLLVVILMLVVIRLRRSLRIGLGDGGNRDLQRAIRVHGNAIESVPIFLVMLELMAASVWGGVSVGPRRACVGIVCVNRCFAWARGGGWGHNDIVGCAGDCQSAQDFLSSVAASAHKK